MTSGELYGESGSSMISFYSKRLIISVTFDWRCIGIRLDRRFKETFSEHLTENLCLIHNPISKEFLLKISRKISNTAFLLHKLISQIGFFTVLFDSDQFNTESSESFFYLK